MKKSRIIFSLFVITILTVASVLDVGAQTARKPTPAREPAGAMSKKSDSSNRFLNKIDSQEDFDRMARTYHQGTPYALPHQMFVVDRRSENKIYFSTLR